MVSPERIAAVKAYCEGNRTAELGMADGIAHLAECLGDVAAEYRQGSRAGVVIALDRLVGEAARVRAEIAR